MADTIKVDESGTEQSKLNDLYSMTAVCPYCTTLHSAFDALTYVNTTDPADNIARIEAGTSLVCPTTFRSLELVRNFAGRDTAGLWTWHVPAREKFGYQGPVQTISTGQLEELDDCIAEAVHGEISPNGTEKLTAALCLQYDVAALKDIPMSCFNECIERVRTVALMRSEMRWWRDNNGERAMVRETVAGG